MQFNKIPAFCCAIIAFGLASCGGDKFSQVIEVDLPEHVPMLSVSAEFSNVDTILLAKIGTTWETTNEPADPNVKNATVRLYENGTLWRELVYDINVFDGYEWVGNANFVADGKTVYRLEVTAPDFEIVFAEQKMPKPVEISKFTYNPQSVVGPDGDKADELTFEFQDPSDEEDYYGLAVYSSFDEIFNEDTFKLVANVYLESYDPLLEEGANELLVVSDKSFNGKKATLKTYSYNAYQGNGNYTIIGHLVHLTREKYLYLRSLNQYQNANGNPFAEPVTVQSNIEKGVGVFSLESLDTVQVKL